MRAAIVALSVISLAVPAFAQAEPPANFDEAAWQAEWDAGDTNGDGRLSRDEVAAANPRALEIFDASDADGDGHISPEEDKAALFKWHGERAEADAAK